MYELILRRFSFDAIKFNDQILACMVVIWVAVVFCALTSIWGQTWTRTRRLAWSVAVVAVPFLGVLVYLPFSWKGRASLSFAFLNRSK
jgi:hypothetical protein